MVIALSLQDLYLNIDQHKLSQVLRNMVSNALKFTPPGGKVVVSATVVTRKASSKLRSPGRRIGSAEHLCRLAFGSQSDIMKSNTSECHDAWDVQTSGSRDARGENQLLRIEVVDSGAGISKVRYVRDSSTYR